MRISNVSANRGKSFRSFPEQKERERERSVFIRILCMVECGFNFRTLTLSYAVRSDRNLLDIFADITMIYVD